MLSPTSWFFPIASMAFSILVFVGSFATAGEPAAPKPSKVISSGAPQSLKPADLKKLRSVVVKYQTSQSATMDVEKKLILGLLNEKRDSKGRLFVSMGRMRMELEGSEKTLLIVNLKKLWAVTYPPAEFKDAALQVITGAVDSKKGQTHAMIGLLAQGGLLKFFQPTGMQKKETGEALYFLQPVKAQTDFKRMQLTLSKDGKSIAELRYWDERDNESHFSFSNVEFGKKLDDKLFIFTPPANADVMQL